MIKKWREVTTYRSIDVVPKRIKKPQRARGRREPEWA